MIRRPVFNCLVAYADDLTYVGDWPSRGKTRTTTTYVFTLESGITYHDGLPFTAADVEFSFNRIVELDTVWSTRLTNVDSYEVDR